MDFFGFDDVEVIDTARRRSRMKDFATRLTCVEDTMRLTLVARFVVTNIDTSTMNWMVALKLMMRRSNTNK